MLELGRNFSPAAEVSFFR